MTLTAAPPITRTADSLVLYDVSWEAYELLLRDLDSQHMSLTYDHGALEFMPPLQTHERWRICLTCLVEELSRELDIPLLNLGSTTFRRKDLERGLEPDACYYLKNAHVVLGKAKIDLLKDPPPDLAIEVDITHRSIAREPIYASLGIPELWRFNSRQLTFLRLGAEGEYVPSEASIAFPRITSAEAEKFLINLPLVDDHGLRRLMREWAAARR